MNCKKTVQKILTLVGGPDNVRDVSHCFTRLRLYLRDKSRADKDSLQKIENVIRVIESGDQLQIVLPGKLDQVFDVFLQAVNAETSCKSIQKEKGARGRSLLSKFSKMFHS